jgi:hypothetical protein
MTYKITIPKSFFLIASLLISTLSFAQEGDRTTRRQKVQQLKIAFFTKELDLSTEEAEKFWPVYNEMAKEIKSKKRDRKVLSKELKEGFDSLSDADFKKKTTEILDLEIEEAELKKEYINKIAGIIGYKKATKLLSLEAKFKRELLNKLSEQKDKREGSESAK